MSTKFEKSQADSQWTFLSNHAHVIVCIARDPFMRVRDIADRVGITERAVMRLIGELKAAGFLAHRRVGRRNRYTLNLDAELRHELEAGVSIREFLSPIVSEAELIAASSFDDDNTDVNDRDELESM